MDIECSRTFLPKQRLILETTKRFPFYSGAFGAGKTLLGCHKTIKECLENPHSVWLCASQTYPQLRDTVLATFMQEVNLLQRLFDDVNTNINLIKDFNKTELKLVFFNGSVVLFRSCEDYSKFKSLNLDGFFVDEPADISQEVFNMLQGRLRGRHTKHHFGILAGNPSNRSSWLYELFFLHPPSNDYFVVQTSSYDNIFLPEGYIKSLEESYDEDWTRRFLKGEWFNFEGLIYPEFNHFVHVKDFSETRFCYTEYFAGFDFGYRNPFCLLVIARDSDDNLIVLEELYRKELTNSEIASEAQEVLRKYADNFHVIWCDPSSPAMIEEFCKYVSCGAANNDVMSGIGKVKSLLKQNRLFVDSGCVNLIRELEGYRYEKNEKDGEFCERPLKRDDHAVDALRYAIMGSGEKTDTYFKLG